MAPLPSGLFAGKQPRHPHVSGHRVSEGTRPFALLKRSLGVCGELLISTQISNSPHTGVGLYRSSDCGDHWERLTGEEFRLAYPDHMMLSPDEKILFMSGAKFHPGFWMGTHVADTTIMRSRDHGRSWDTEPKGFAVAPRANIEALTMACWPGGYELFVGDTEGTVHMSEDGGDSWTRIADEVGCVTKGNHAAALRGEIRPRTAAAH